MSVNDLREWITLLQPSVMGLLGVIAWLLRTIGTQLIGIRTELKTLNGRMVEMEAWRHAHEPLVDRRLAAIESRCERFLSTTIHRDS